MKRLFCIVSAVTFFFMNLTLALPVAADIGPKPSVRVTFVNAPDTTYYATLLSEKKSTGPASAWDGTSPDSESLTRRHGDNALELWEKFLGYADADGYYFLQEWWNCTDTDELAWTYYPPTPFKVLVYYPDTDEFAVSGIYERYAFDSYYTIDLAGDGMTAAKSYDHSREIVSLISRIVLTITIEYLIALAFGYREKRWLCVIMVVNVLTQVGLNIALNAINFYEGAWAFVFFYVVLEFAVFVAEAVAYVFLHRKFGENAGTYRRAVGYAFVANLVSFVGGMALAWIIPGIF